MPHFIFDFIYLRYFNGGPPAETDFGGDVSVFMFTFFVNGFRGWLL